MAAAAAAAPPPHSGHRDEKGRRRARDRPHLADVGRLLPVLLPAPQQTPFGARHGPRTRGGETAARRKRRKRRRRKRGRKRRRRKRGRKRRRRKRGENGGGGGGTGGRSGGNEGLERRRRKRAAGRKARLRSASTGTALAADWMAGRFARGKQRVAREGMGRYGPRKLRADAVTFCSHSGREGCAPLGGPGPRKENAPSAETDKGRSAVAGRAGGHREEEGLAVDVVQVDPSRQLPHLAAPPPPPPPPPAFTRSQSQIPVAAYPLLLVALQSWRGSYYGRRLRCSFRAGQRAGTCRGGSRTPAPGGARTFHCSCTPRS